MKIENREQANAICDEIQMLDSILENLSAEPLLVGLKHLEGKPFLIIPLDDSKLGSHAKTFVSTVILTFSRKREQLVRELEQL